MKYAVIALIACICYASERKITKKTLGMMVGLLVLAYLMGIWGKEGVSKVCPWYSSPCAKCPTECGWLFGFGCMFKDFPKDCPKTAGASDKCSDPTCSGENKCIKKSTDVCGGQTEEQCKEDGDTWCGDGPTCQDKMVELCADARKKSAGECDQCMGTHQHQLQVAGCTNSDFSTFCSGGGGGGESCDVTKYLKAFNPPNASLTRFDNSTEITVENRIGKDAYIHVVGGTIWSHMSSIDNGTTKNYYIGPYTDYGVNFKLFTTEKDNCDTALGHTSLFEITTSPTYPSVDISFNAGVNFGIKFVATAEDGTKLTRVATNSKSPVAYGLPGDSPCQVQQCASANNMKDYDTTPSRDLTDSFRNGKFTNVTVIFFPLNDATYMDTRGPCGTVQCPGYDCKGHNDYKIKTNFGDADICTTSGSGKYCWVDFDPKGVSDEELNKYYSVGGKICPKCEYVNNSEYDSYPIDDRNNCSR